jgi:hypothetical protein
MAVLVPSSTGSPYQVMMSDDASSINWLTHMLEPWFAGGAYPNADVLRGVFAALVASPGRVLFRSETGEADAERGLERYAAARSRFAPDEARFNGLGPDDD